MRFLHTVDVTRLLKGKDANGQTQRGQSVVATAHPCLIEGARGTAKQLGAGRIPRNSYVMTWSDLELHDGDLVTWLERGKLFTVRQVLDDTTRPTRAYYTAELVERAE